MMEAPELIVTNSQGTAIVTEQVRHPRDVTYFRSDLLIDPNAVHMNMLRGTLAKPSVDQIVHIYGPEALALSPEVAKLVAEAEARGMERAAAFLDARHTTYMTSKGRNPQDYGSGFSLSADALRSEAAAIRRAAEGTGT